MLAFLSLRFIVFHRVTEIAELTRTDFDSTMKRVTVQGITRQAIFKICSKRALEAKIPDFSPHDFRRTFVGNLLDAGADIVTVKDLAGHASDDGTL